MQASTTNGIRRTQMPAEIDSVLSAAEQVRPRFLPRFLGVRGRASRRQRT
jgi:hypothetical protein